MNQYKVVAEAAESTPERTTVLDLFRHAYRDRQRVWKVYDTPDSARRAVAALTARGIAAAIYGRYWGGSWQLLDDNH